MILVDTSAWVEFDRETGSPLDLRLTSLVESESPIASTEPVLMELLAGARSDTDAARLRRLLVSNVWYSVRFSDYDAAAAIYRMCRRAGLEPGGSIDCLIAAVALRSNVPVLASDGDFAQIARVVPLRLDSYN